MYNFEGILKGFGPVREITGRNCNQSTAIDVIIEHERGQYPKQIVVTMWNEKIEETKQKGLQAGVKVKVWAYVESREYNGKWYTNCRLANIERVQEIIPSNEEMVRRSNEFVEAAMGSPAQQTTYQPMQIVELPF